MSAVVLALIAVLLLVAHEATAAKATTNSTITVALSSTTATGLLIGIALIAVLSFGLNMMQGIQISDTITDAATESN